MQNPYALYGMPPAGMPPGGGAAPPIVPGSQSLPQQPGPMAGMNAGMNNPMNPGMVNPQMGSGMLGQQSPAMGMDQHQPTMMNPQMGGMTGPQAGGMEKQLQDLLQQQALIAQQLQMQGSDCAAGTGGFAPSLPGGNFPPHPGGAQQLQAPFGSQQPGAPLGSVGQAMKNKTNYSAFSARSATPAGFTPQISSRVVSDFSGVPEKPTGFSRRAGSPSPRSGTRADDKPPEPSRFVTIRKLHDSVDSDALEEAATNFCINVALSAPTNVSVPTTVANRTGFSRAPPSKTGTLEFAAVELATAFVEKSRGCLMVGGRACDVEMRDDSRRDNNFGERNRTMRAEGQGFNRDGTSRGGGATTRATNTVLLKGVSSK